MKTASLMKRWRRGVAFLKWLASPRSVSIHGVIASTEPALAPRNVRKALYEGVYEAEEARACREHLRPGDRVLELGGGVGVISTVCATICGSKNVLTYEANPILEPVIRRNYELNNVSPELRLKAVSSEPGSLTFFANPNILSSSLIKRKGGEEITVETDGVADICAEFRPNCLICDIEGEEVKVLPAADLSKIRLILAEVHPHIVGDAKIEALIDYLKAQGFQTTLRHIQLTARREGA